MWRNLYNRVREKLLKTYRVELIDDITLSQSRQVILKPITVVVVASLLLLGVILGSMALVVLVPPLHRMIPGYSDVSTYKKENEQLSRQLSKMEQEIARWDTYRESLMKIAGVVDDSLGSVNEAMLDSLRRVREASAPVQAEATPDAKLPEPETQSGDTEPQSEQVRVVYLPQSQMGTPVRLLDRRLLTRLFPPVEGTLRNKFNLADRHYGIDIVAPAQSMIRSVSAGVVVISEYSEASGWVIGVASREGEDQLVTFYKHNSRLLKPAGSYVMAGEPLAVIGNTGENSSGPHLHLELWYNGRPVDPASYLTLN